MSALTDLQAGQAAIAKAVSDTAAFLNSLASTVSGGVSAADAESIAADLQAKAQTLEALVAPPASGGTSAAAKPAGS